MSRQRSKSYYNMWTKSGKYRRKKHIIENAALARSAKAHIAPTAESGVPVIDVMLTSTDSNVNLTTVTAAITTMTSHISTADGDTHVAPVTASTGTITSHATNADVDGTVTDLSASIATITSHATTADGDGPVTDVPASIATIKFHDTTVDGDDPVIGVPVSTDTITAATFADGFTPVILYQRLLLPWHPPPLLQMVMLLPHPCLD